ARGLDGPCQRGPWVRTAHRQSCGKSGVNDNDDEREMFKADFGIDARFDDILERSDGAYGITLAGMRPDVDAALVDHEMPSRRGLDIVPPGPAPAEWAPIVMCTG